MSALRKMGDGSASRFDSIPEGEAVLEGSLQLVFNPPK